MGFMSSIINALNSVGSWFYQIYQEVYGWVYPFWLAAGLFYQLSNLFSTLAWRFYDFSDWVSDVQSKIGNFLSWSTIWSYILSYVPNLVSIRDWFYSWYTNVTGAVTSWWSSMQWTVRGWIDAAVQGLGTMAAAWNNFWNNLWPQLTADFNSLRSDWGNFWRITVPDLVNFSWLETWWQDRTRDIDGLISSGFSTRASLWEGWDIMRDKVVSFFADPVEYIWGRFTEWFLGPEG
jgi:hypothetical protein